MRNLILFLALIVCTFVSKMSAQETFEAQAKTIAERMTTINNEEKKNLKKLVEDVNVALEKNQITKQAADEQKLALATASARNIEKRIGEQQDKLNQLVQDKVSGKISTTSDRKLISITNRIQDSIKKVNGESRTTTQAVFIAGLNNVVTNGSLNNSDFRYWGSHFYEFGFTANTRLLKDNNLLHAKYGISLMLNSLRPADNRLFQVSGNTTSLVDATVPLDDARFRNTYLVVPLHLEFDFSPNNVAAGGKPYFKSHKSVRLGVGGYAGMNLESRQFIETKANGYDTESETTGDFNTSNFIYGLSAYLGYRETSLYVKYDLNPLFNNNPIKQNNISLGLRFDFN